MATSRGAFPNFAAATGSNLPSANGLAALHAMVKGRAATLITATREVDLSHAAVMREMLLQKKK